MKSAKQTEKEKDLGTSNDFEIPIGEIFKLNAKKKLGSGAFGDIYYGIVFFT